MTGFSFPLFAPKPAPMDPMYQPLVTRDPEHFMLGKGKLRRYGVEVSRQTHQMRGPDGKCCWYVHYTLTRKDNSVVQWLYNIATGTTHENVTDFVIASPVSAGGK